MGNNHPLKIRHRSGRSRLSKTDGQKSVVWPGEPYPLGATWDGEGINFALFSENAEKVELCLFDPSGRREVERIEIREHTNQIWHCYLPYGRLGQLYGYRVYGPHDPSNGHRFNPNKLLLDPYAKAISGTIDWHDSVFGYKIGHPDEDLSFNQTNSAPYVPRSVVIDPQFDWENETSPRIPYDQSVIYEVHVKEFTKL